MDRVILHSDMNNCYANIELLHNPGLRGRPLAVGGDPEARHGIVLAKDQLAKKAGVKTGMALWQARQVCPEIQFVPPDMDKYLRFSRLAGEIYADYTDHTEPFGIDESWLDVTESCSLMGDGMHVALEIGRRIKSELGITVSIGVSWNKIFAKLGSDYKKPDAVTAITRDNYRDIVWPLAAKELLYVGPATERKLAAHGIRTIGDLAAADPGYLHARFGKMGGILRAFANGEDKTPVSLTGERAPIKSIGNSTTAPRDLVDEADARIVVYMLAEAVAMRLRDNHFKGRVIEVSVRDSSLISITRQKKISAPTNISDEIALAAMRLIKENYRWEKPVRSIGVRAADLVPEDFPVQLELFKSERRREKQERFEKAVDEIRLRFGHCAVRRGVMYTDRPLSSADICEAAVVHPHGYMEYGNRTGISA